MTSSASFQEAVAAFQRGDLDSARSLAQAAEKSAPSPQLNHLLGLIECRAGNLDEGISRLRKASSADPANAGFKVMLARALIDRGLYSEALAVAQPSAAASPAELALWQARGEAALAAGDSAMAAEAWRMVSSVRPDDWRAWANLGEALARLDRWQEAAKAFRRASGLNPADSALRRNLTSALSKSDQFEEAAEGLQRLLDDEDDDLVSRILLARLLADLGRDRESREQLEKAAALSLGASAGAGSDRPIAIALGPDDDCKSPLTEDQSKSVAELALLFERTNRIDELRALLDDAESRGMARSELAYPAAALAFRDGDLDQARELLQLGSWASDPVRSFRLLARIEDSAGNVAASFAATEAMNRSARDYDAWVERGDKLIAGLRGFADRMDARWVGRLQPLKPSARRSPAFLVGFPRSGTTLLDTFLMGHPETAVLEELNMLREAEAVLGPIADLPNVPERQLEQARDAYFEELDRHVGQGFDGLAVDKFPLNMVGLPMIHALFPDARIIFAQRHPCDCVLSGFMQSFALNDAMGCFLTVEGSAGLYDSAMRVFTKSCELLPVAVQTLVYEDLVRAPEDSLRPLIDFLGLEWRPELLDHRTTAKARGAINTPSYDQVVRPLDKAPSGRWKRYAVQLQPVLPTLLPWAKRLGYPE